MCLFFNIRDNWFNFISIGVARILSAGVHFFAKKVDDLFLVVAV